MIKFLQKGDLYLSLRTVAHYFLMRLEIRCGANEKQLVFSQLSYKLERNIVKWLTLTWKQTEKKTR